MLGKQYGLLQWRKNIPLTPFKGGISLSTVIWLDFYYIL
jgi:hypothetical protein